MPESCRSSCEIHVQEVICGDPSCSPVDTAVLLQFASGGQGQFGIPADPKEITEDDLKEFMPPNNILVEWFNGNSVVWSPYDDMPDEYALDPDMLRFNVGDKVECRVGTDPITGWEKGEVIQIFYREQNWPPGQVAPYKIELVSGKMIFAPQ
eukprot:CAMPEP_0118639344 /NCGR_PEP_ID=MMETSP0785-20121206/4172_1 /TAXON_ID=91992 /ORGANISM="Bolidomonas pacifica, Strain CCMP 1866" /LENGTH=151 /DNA_ID=CAMNT_0006530663 /DNA_START=66 /DNA_END=518 /DNA_ORIENTATION=-